MPIQFTWTDVEEIALRLCAEHPEVDPLTVRFTALRALVEGLEGFAPPANQHVNEKILEAIQGAWHEEREDARADDE